MEPVEFALSLIPELRHQVHAMINRIEKFRRDTETYQSLKTELDKMAKLITKMEGAQKLNLTRYLRCPLLGFRAD